MRRFHSLKIWSLGVLALVIISMGGCGSNGNQPDSDSPSLPTESRDPMDESKIFRGGGKVKGENACRTVTVRTGSKSEAIDFVARCSGRKEDGVIFFVQSFSAKNSNERLEITGYTQNPSVKGRGAISPQGDCSMDEDILTCKATINGPIVLAGRFFVKAKSRCAAVVYVTGQTVPPCRGEFCEGGPRFDELFRGRPRGCGAASS